MSRCTHSNAVSILLLGGVVFPLAGCEMLNLRAVRANKEEQPNGVPVTLDDMILKSIQRNVSNIDSQMSPYEAVAVLGVQGFGLRDGTADSLNDAAYDFVNSKSRLIIRGEYSTICSSGFCDTRGITDVIFQRSDSTRTQFAVGGSK